MASENGMGYYDSYQAQRVVVKLAVQIANRMADQQGGEQFFNVFEGNEKMFWKKVQQW